MVDQEKLPIDLWTRLVERANEEQIVINGHPVTALSDTGSILEPGYNRVAVGLKNISAKAITIPSRIVVDKLQQARVVPDDKAFKLKQSPTGEGGPLDLGSIEFGGIRKLDRGSAAISQGPIG